MKKNIEDALGYIQRAVPDIARKCGLRQHEVWQVMRVISSMQSLWHPGAELPKLSELSHADGTLFLVEVRDKTAFDSDVFFCFYDEGQAEPWGVMNLPGTHYPVRIPQCDVEKWCIVDELIIKNT